MSTFDSINEPPSANSVAAGGCVYPQPSYQSQWVPPQTVETTVTETCEYDEEGRMVKKTTTTTTVTRGGSYTGPYTGNSPYISVYGNGVLPCSGS